MTRGKVDYSNGLIYKICCKDKNVKEVYIGSTTNFRKRKNEHKRACRYENLKKYNYPVYRFIRDNGGWDNWEMIEMEKYPCNDKRELEKKEEQIRSETPNNLNAYRAYQEEDNNERHKIYYYNGKGCDVKKKYYKENREKVLLSKGEKFLCECGSYVRKGEKARHFRSKKHQSYKKNNSDI